MKLNDRPVGRAVTYSSLDRPGARIAWGVEINFGRAREVYLCEFEGGTGSLLECGTNEKGEDQKKKVFSTKISTNSSCCLKILAISHEFLSEDQKKQVFVSNVLWNPVWVHKNYEKTVLAREF